MEQKSISVPTVVFISLAIRLMWVEATGKTEYSWLITVGDNVWFGAGVRVIPEVTIASNAIIGAGSIVVKNILIMWWRLKIHAGY